MALKITYQSKYGITISDAYARINTFSGNKANISTIVDVFATEIASQNGSYSIGTIVIDLPLAEGATMAQMYSALKLDSNFIDAVDC